MWSNHTGHLIVTKNLFPNWSIFTSCAICPLWVIRAILSHLSLIVSFWATWNLGVWASWIHVCHFDLLALIRETPWLVPITQCFHRGWCCSIVSNRIFLCLISLPFNCHFLNERWMAGWNLIDGHLLHGNGITHPPPTDRDKTRNWEHVENPGKSGFRHCRVFIGVLK